MSDVNDNSMADVSWDDIPETSTDVAQDVTASVAANPEINESTEVVEATPAEMDTEVKGDDSHKSNNPITLTKELEELGLTLTETGELALKYKADGVDAVKALKDIKTHEAGQTAWDKKFSEFDKKDKDLVAREASYKKELAQVNSYINTFRDRMKGEQGPLKAMEYLGELGGMPGHQVKENLIKALTPEIIRRAQLNPLELQNEQLIEEKKYLEDLRKSDIEKANSEQALADLENKANSFRETYKIEPTEWKDAVSFLKDHPGTPKNLLDNPEFVSNYIRLDRASKFGEGLIKEYDASLLQDNGVVDTLRDIIFENPDFTESDLKDLLSTAIKTEKDKQLVQQVAQKTVAKGAVPKAQKQQPNISKSDYKDLDWDNI